MNRCALNDLMEQFVDYQISNWMDVEKPVPNTINNEGPPIRKLFVGNINGRSTYRDLKRLFSAFGKVKDAHISRSRYTRKKKNYGFVTFENPEDAAAVLNLEEGELELYNRVLYIAPADSWHQPEELANGTVIWHPKGPKQNSAGNDQSEDSATVASADSGNEPAAAEHVSNCSSVCASRASTPEVVQEDDIRKEDDDINEEDCKIRMLNDDCLIHVFSFLSKRDRIKVERVCKRWQQVCWNMWRSQKHLDFTSVFPHGSAYYMNCSILNSFLRRCGKNLKSLDLSYKPHNLSQNVTRLIAQYCHNLEKLDLTGLPITNNSLRPLYPVVEHLRTLSLEGCHGATDKELLHLFNRCKSLEILILSRLNNLTGKCFTGLAKSPLQKLVLDDSNNLRSHLLLRGLSTMSELTDLSLNSCINLTSSDVSQIVTVVPGLLRLSMNRYFPLFSNSTLQPLSKLLSLEVLDLQLNQAVNDQVMNAISKGCLNIRKLNITGCSINSWEQPSLTDVGLGYISNLPHLVDLSMSYLANVTDASLIAISEKGRLRKLECRGCPTFTDNGCSRVVASCNELELFDLSGCDVVTEVTVKAAVEAVKLRTNNTKLVLVVGGCSTKELERIEQHPLLEVDTKDFCIAHLRPDFVDDIYFPSSENDDDDDDFADELCDFDWETHSLLFGDDIEYYEDFFDDDDDDEACAFTHVGFYC